MNPAPPSPSHLLKEEDCRHPGAGLGTCGVSDLTARRDPVEHQAFVDAKRAARMAQIDALPPATRDLVHEYGFTVVKPFLELGVTKPRHIRHLVETVLNEFSPTRGSFAHQGPKSVLAMVEGFLPEPLKGGQR